MAVNERLNKFNSSKRGAILLYLALFQAKLFMPKVAPGIRPANAHFSPVKPLQPTKFSDDTERLQHINSIGKSTVGAQMKLVIDLLYKIMYKKSNLMQLLQLSTIFLASILKTGRLFPFADPASEVTRQAFTAEQINEATYVDIHGNKTLFDSLRNNPKVKLDGRHFSCKPTHVLTGRDQWHSLIKKQVDGIVVEEVKDAYPSVLKDLQVTSGGYHALTPRKTPRTSTILKQLFRGTELPRDMLDIEELKKIGEKPSTGTAKRRALAEIRGAASKSNARKKQRGITSRTKLTNRHLPEMFGLLST